MIDSDLKPDIFAAVSSGGTPASTIEEHLAQLVTLDAQHHEHQMQQQSVSGLQGGAPENAATSQHTFEEGSDVGAGQSRWAASKHQHTLLLIAAVVLVVAAIVVAALVALKLDLQPVSACGHDAVARPVFWDTQVVWR